MPEPLRAHENGKTAHTTDGVIEPSRSERRSMHRLVEQREQEDDQHALGQREYRSQCATAQDHHRRCRDCTEMAGEVRESGHIGARDETSSLRRGESGDDGPMVDVRHSEFHTLLAAAIDRP